MKAHINGAMAIVVAAGLWLAAPAFGRSVMTFEDAELVNRADLIVLGTIKEGSIQSTVQRHGDSLEYAIYTATLKVQTLVKGELDAKEIPLVVGNGLMLLVDGKAKNNEYETDLTLQLPKGLKSGSIQLFDVEMNGGDGPLIADARHPAVWLLRRRAGGDYEIRGYQDAQPASLQPYFQCYLAADPEAALRAILPAQPEIAARAVRYLQRREIDRIAKEPDLDVRITRLLPYYQMQDGRTAWYAREELLKCGPKTGAYLMGLYQDSREPRLREDIVRLWGRMQYAAATDAIINMMGEQDKFWGTQKLTKDWWTDGNIDPSLTKYRQESYGLVQAGIETLGAIGDGKARAILLSTSARWEGFGFDNGIAKMCSEAMALLR